jgi:hypothetical protein
MSSAKRRNTIAGSWRPNPAASRRTCGLIAAGQVATVALIAPTG